MNKLTQQDFQDRIQAVARSRKIFIESGITNNISHAFTLYQGVLAEQERPLTLQGSKDGIRPRTILDDYQRPACPYCGADIMFLPVTPAVQGIQMHLVCFNPECDHFWFSRKSIQEWILFLQQGRANEVDFSAMAQGSKKGEKRKTRRLNLRASRKETKQFEPIEASCPKCRGGTLYKIKACCGHPEGLIECGECEFQQDPRLFRERSE